MIGNSNMLVIREDHKILRVITTDRKCKFLWSEGLFPGSTAYIVTVFSPAVVQKDIYRPQKETYRKLRYEAHHWNPLFQEW